MRRSRLLHDALEHRQLGLCRRAARYERHEVAGAHGATAGHLPCCGPAQSTRHWVGELVDVFDHEFQRLGIQLDERVSQIIVVWQQEVDVLFLAAYKLRNIGGLAVDIHLDAIGANGLAVYQVVDAHACAVGAQRLATLDQLCGGDDPGVVSV